jgi:NAD(P)-dependent dehydrogenase (short-subunit alcohol dehydrogenase family)
VNLGLLFEKVAIITGAASGVGKAAARLFSEHSAKLVLADVDQAGLDLLVLELPDAAAIRCDVGSDSDVEELVAFAVERFGHLDVMYNNAGVASPVGETGKVLLLEQCDDGHFERLVRINLGGVFHGCKHAARQFRRQGIGGAIVNTASVAGLIGWGGALYGGTKGGVVALTRTLAIELAPIKVRVNSVCPAAMITNFGRTQPLTKVTAEMHQIYSTMHPLGKPIEPYDCAAAALFLASDLAANVTGVNLPVDGGLSAS